MRLRHLNESEIDVWPAFTDFLTSVLIIVVIFVFGILFSNIARSLVRRHSEFEDMLTNQQAVHRQLEQDLGKQRVEISENGSLQRIILRVDEQGGGGVLFQSGRADLSQPGKDLLSKIAEVLLGYAYHYIVEHRADRDAAPTRYVVEITPLRFVATSSSTFSSGITCSLPIQPSPALLTRTSMRSWSRSAAATKAFASTRWPTSSLRTVTSGAPFSRHACATAFSCSTRRAPRTRLDFLRANARAAASPIPLDAPVMTTTAPLSRTLATLGGT